MKGHRAGVSPAILLSLSLLWCSAAAAQPCRLALLLAMDVSSSVDDTEHKLQRQGLARALLSPRVTRAIMQGPGAVAVSVYEWSGRRQHKVILDWRLLTSHSAITAAAQQIVNTPRSHEGFPTALGYAMGFGHSHLRRAPTCDRQVIDVSGDGRNNDGFGPRLAYKHFDFSSITVNGLAITGDDRGILRYYQSNIAHGPGAFVETANGFADFERAIGAKLERELSIVMLGTRSP